jgi:hypothetical protein
MVLFQNSAPREFGVGAGIFDYPLVLKDRTNVIPLQIPR